MSEPEKRKRGPWMQVVLAAVVMLATLPGRTQGLGLATEPLLADLRLDRVTYANLNLWASLIGALFCFPAGWAVDRLGLRWVTGGVVLLLGAVVWQLSAFNGSLGLLFALLLATRALGQSALSVCSISTVGKWFSGRVGLPMGVYSVLLSVLFAIAFGVVGFSIRQSGWRAAWLQMALGLAFVIAPMVLFFLREPGAASQPTAEQTQTRSLSLAEALRTRLFWVFAGAAASFNLVSSGLGLFNEAVLAERGFDRKTFHIFLIVTTLTSLLGQFGCGWLATRWKYQTLTMIALAIYASSLGAIPVLAALWQLWFVALLMGIAGGMIIVIFFAIWSEAFGPRHLGRIQGAAQMLTVISSAAGPVIFAKSFAATGSYSVVLVVLAAAVLLLAAAAKTVRVPPAKGATVYP